MNNSEFELVYQKYAKQLFYFLLKLCGDYEDVYKRQPESVPAGRMESIASTASRSFRIVPDTVEPMCITWENLSLIHI